MTHLAIGTWYRRRAAAHLPPMRCRYPASSCDWACSGGHSTRPTSVTWSPQSTSATPWGSIPSSSSSRTCRGRRWESATISPPEDRLAMVEAAVQGVAGPRGQPHRDRPRRAVVHRGHPCRPARRDQPGAELFLVLGSDAAAGLTTWERVDEVRAGCTVVVVDRPGAEGEAPPPGWRWERVEVPRLDVSSTDLRARAADGRPLDYLLPPESSRASATRGLYAPAMQP